METTKTGARKKFQKQFLIVGVAVFLMFSVATIFVLHGKSQQVALKKLSKSSSTLKPKGSALRIYVDESPTDTEPDDDEGTSGQLIEKQQAAFEVSDGNDKNDFLTQLSAPPPRKGSNIVGIENIGNSCYANSTFQALFRNSEIRRIVFNLESYLPRLTKDCDELLELVKANKRFLQLKTSHLVLYGRDLSLENLLVRFGAFIDIFPAEQEELKKKLQASLLDFEILYITKKLHLNFRMIDKIYYKPDAKSNDFMKLLLTDSIILLDQLILAFGRPGKDIGDSKYYANNKRSVLADLLRTSDFSSKKLENIGRRYTESPKFIIKLAGTIRFLEENYGEVRQSDLPADLVLELHEIFNEAKFYNLYEIKKLENQVLMVRIEEMITGYKAVEGLQSVFQDLQANSKGKPVTISGDEKKFQSFPGEFGMNEQEDANGYFLFLMNAIKEVIPPSQSKHVELKLIIKKVLKIQGFEDERQDIPTPLMCISLMDVESSDFERSLAMIFSDDLIEGVKSDKLCGENGDCVTGTLNKSYRIENIPSLVPIRLQRFRSNGNNHTDEKIENEFKMPEYIDFAPYLEPKSETPVMYRIKTIIYHVGGCQGGHYYSFTRDGDRWYELNDSRVSRAPEADIIRAMNYGYMYFYERVETLALTET